MSRRIVFTRPRAFSAAKALARAWGAIDLHIHCGMPILGGPSNVEVFSAPPEQVSRAAFYGGTTTLLDFALRLPEAPLQQSIEAR